MITETQQQVVETVEDSNSRANLYRTRWLISHNALHGLVHKTILGAQNIDSAIREPVEKQFQAYLLELRRAGEIASQTA